MTDTATASDTSIEGPTLPEVEVSASRDAPTSTEGLQTELQRALDAYGNLVPSAAEIASEKADVARDRAKEDQLADAEIANLEKGFDRPEPQRDTNVMGGLFPLLAIAAFGGKLTGANASAMLGSSIGMVQGYTQGKEDIYQENLKNYQQAYQRFRDNQEQIDKVYKVMREAYANRIDGDQKALQMAYELTGNQVKNVQTLLQDHENVKQWTDQVHHWNDQMEEEKIFHRMQISIDQRKARVEERKETLLEQQNATAERMASSDGAVGMVLSGMPLNQVLPGYSKNAAAQRAILRDGAIAKIKADSPGMTDIEAGEELARRQVAFVAGKSSTTQLTRMLGATRQAVAQLDFNIKQTTQEMKKIGSSDLSPVVNAIARGEEKWTGNPAYSSLFFYMSAAATESARIIAGGQASTAQLHQGAADEAKKWASINMTPASWGAVSQAMLAEGANRLQNYQAAIQANEEVPVTPTKAGAPPAATPQPVTARTGQTGHKEGDKKLSKKGEAMVWHNGQWEYEGG
jgi:hypothetical protein